MTDAAETTWFLEDGTDHPQTRIAYPFEYDEFPAVDTGIAPLLAEMWRLDLRTWASCEGFADAEPPDPDAAYIAFDEGAAASARFLAMLPEADRDAVAIDADGGCARFPRRFITSWAASLREMPS